MRTKKHQNNMVAVTSPVNYLLNGVLFVLVGWCIIRINLGTSCQETGESSSIFRDPPRLFPHDLWVGRLTSSTPWVTLKPFIPLTHIMIIHHVPPSTIISENWSSLTAIIITTTITNHHSPALTSTDYHFMAPPLTSFNHHWEWPLLHSDFIAKSINHCR